MVGAFRRTVLRGMHDGLAQSAMQGDGLLELDVEGCVRFPIVAKVQRQPQTGPDVLDAPLNQRMGDQYAVRHGVVVVQRIERQRGVHGVKPVDG